MNEKLINFLDKYRLQGKYSCGGNCGVIDKFSFDEEPFLEDANFVNMTQLWWRVYERTVSAYGSWAGEYDACGDISYDNEKKLIVVEGNEGSEAIVKQVANFTFTLSGFFQAADAKRVSYVFLRVNNSEDSEVHIPVENGPWTDFLEKAEQDIRYFLNLFYDKCSSDEHLRVYISGDYTIDQTVELYADRLISTPQFWTIDLKRVPYDSPLIFKQHERTADNLPG